MLTSQNSSDRLELNFQRDIENINQIDGISKLLQVVCKVTGMGFAAIARVTEDRWITCISNDNLNFGLKAGDELAVNSTICYEIEKSHRAVIINNVSEDPAYRQHHKPIQYGFQSYISVPIILKNNEFFGTICALDPAPADLGRAEVLMMFELYADMIAVHLNSLQEVHATQDSLKEEIQTSELRDQFIAILGHDLRNPVGAIRNSAELLQRGNLNPRDQRLINIIQNSTYRITGLIDNVLDFARGRLGDGVSLNFQNEQSMEETLKQVIDELQTISPDKKIIPYFLIQNEMRCDFKRIAQLFSNILANAIAYGDSNSAIIVKASVNEDNFQLSVHNAGKKIPKEKLAKLFQPFQRGASSNNKDGLGLGLYISSEIAKAHGGTLSVESTTLETCFELVIPTK
ncbi:GAF domain-containing sensor histidine kinase [Pedobacter sp. UYP1]|uniref:GAF domain-containing sensor histidine kinase n=1 Tax=Pedobacter sp. UYP1 TaxID=1756396 RepID=UPI003395BC86